MSWNDRDVTRISRVSILTVWFVAILAITACDDATAPRIREVPSPAHILKVAGDNQQGAPGAQLDSVVIVVQDSSGRPVGGAQVTFSVTRGDGFLAATTAGSIDTAHATPRHGPILLVTNAKGEAMVRWWIGRSGENTLTATTEIPEKILEVTFRATAAPSGYGGGSFALSGATPFVLLANSAAGALKCTAISSSLLLSSDGSFEQKRHFNCALLFGDLGEFDVTETGFYNISGSTILLHYFDSANAGGLFEPRDVLGAMTENEVVQKDFDVEWRYQKVE